MNTRPLLASLVILSLGLGPRLFAAETDPALASGYTVTVELRMNEEGSPEGIRLIDSEDTTPGEVLDKMAIAMAQQLKLPPREKDGHRVKFSARIPYFFPIEGDEGAASNKGPKPHPKLPAIQPAYPLALAEQEIVGGAILELVVNSEGRLTRLTTLRASRPEFEQAATQAVSQWTFAPAMKDGKAVEARCRLAVVFESPDKMADLKWRIAPRPSLGSIVVGHNNKIPPTPAPAPEPAK
jgi:TonB family protein